MEKTCNLLVSYVIFLKYINRLKVSDFRLFSAVYKVIVSKEL